MFDDMDRGFYKYMPNGKKEEIFNEKVKATKSTERTLKKSATTFVGMKMKKFK